MNGFPSADSPSKRGQALAGVQSDAGFFVEEGLGGNSDIGKDNFLKRHLKVFIETNTCLHLCNKDAF